MAIYPGRRPKTWRVVVWTKNRSNEWIVEGNKKDAVAFEARQKLVLQAVPKSATRIAPTFSAFCAADYRPHAETHLGADTWNKVRIYQVLTLEEHFGPIRLDRISSRDVDEFKLVRRGDVQPVSINNELRVLRAMLNWGRRVRKLSIAELTIELLPIKGDDRVRFWSESEVDRLLAAARELEPELLPMLIFMLNTGCRKGEAIAAEWSWIKAGKLCIPVTEYWQPKNKKPREVPLSDAVKAVLASHRKHERWIFPSQIGARYTYFPKEAFGHVRDAAGLEGGPHRSRHTFASHFLAAIPDLFLLAKLLGHSNQRTTELYAHLLQEHLERARNAVNFSPKTMAVTVAKK